VERFARLGFFGIAATDGTSDVAEKRGYRKITLGFIQRHRLGIITSGFQDYRTKTAATNLVFQVPQDLSGDASTSRTRPYIHALNLNASLSDWPEPAAAYRVIRFSRDHEISARLLEFGCIDPANPHSWIKRGELGVQLANQLTSLFERWTYRYDHFCFCLK